MEKKNEMGQEVANILLRGAFNQVHRGRILKPTRGQEDCTGKQGSRHAQGKRDPEEKLV